MRTDHLEQGNASRPEKPEDLLREPILDVVTADGLVQGSCYRNWELDHGKLRFYVSGYLEFLRAGVVKDTKQLGAKFGEDAIRVAETATSWTKMPGPDGIWRQLSPNQFRAARRGEPMFFQKAALVILAAEQALRYALRQGRSFAGLREPEDVYAFMKIVPACYNVDGLNSAFYDSADPALLARIAERAGQPVQVLHDLAKAKQTVTAQTAIAIANASGLGPARGKPGRYLGAARASEHEKLDLG